MDDIFRIVPFHLHNYLTVDFQHSMSIMAIVWYLWSGSLYGIILSHLAHRKYFFVSVLNYKCLIKDWKYFQKVCKIFTHVQTHMHMHAIYFSLTQRTSPPIDSLPEFRVCFNKIILCTNNGTFGKVHVLNFLTNSARKNTVAFENCISIFSVSSPSIYIECNLERPQFPGVLFLRQTFHRKIPYTFNFIYRTWIWQCFFFPLQFLPGFNRISLLSLNRNIYKEM